MFPVRGIVVGPGLELRHAALHRPRGPWARHTVVELARRYKSYLSFSLSLSLSLTPSLSLFFLSLSRLPPDLSDITLVNVYPLPHTLFFPLFSFFSWIESLRNHLKKQITIISVYVSLSLSLFLLIILISFSSILIYRSY